MPVWNGASIIAEGGIGLIRKSQYEGSFPDKSADVEELGGFGWLRAELAAHSSRSASVGFSLDALTGSARDRGRRE